MEFDLPEYRSPSRRYFSRGTLAVAESLLGAYIRHETPDGVTGGMIVETEGYLEDEEGCHAFRGMTNRNRAMFGPPGYAYVYFTYGNHWMLNIVTEKEGRGCAVLIRALEPIEGIDLMRKRRPQAKRTIDLANGPGKLAAALGIGRDQYGLDVLDSPLCLLVPSASVRNQIIREYAGIVQTTRIGLGDDCGGKDLPYRFHLKDHPCVSVKAR